MKLSPLIAGTLAGAAVGFMLAPAQMGNLNHSEEWAWQEIYYVVGGAAIGTIGGLIWDHVRNRRLRPPSD
jgi:hypothetical protein